MNKFDYQFKKKLEQHEMPAPEKMWSKISSELNEEKEAESKIVPMGRSFGWMWKTATAAALVFSIVSISLISLDRSGNSNGEVVSEVNGEVDGYGNGFEKPFFSADKVNVAFGNAEESENEEAMANVDEAGNTPDDVSAPTYSMKILTEEEGVAAEYEILGPDGSVSTPSAYHQMMRSASSGIVQSTVEAIQK